MQIQTVRIPKKLKREVFAPMRWRTRAIYMQAEKYPPTLKWSYVAKKGEDVSKENMGLSTHLA